MHSFAPYLSLFLSGVLGYNFPNEAIQLSEADVRDNPDLAFGNVNTLKQVVNEARCKVWPGDTDWPSQTRWDAFNTSLGGVLIKGVPPASYCYPGDGFDDAKCAAARSGFSSATFFMEDPVSPFGQWQTGNSCPLPATNANYTCTSNGTPAYVVNATTVKHVQLAVNFARNNNIRLVIKNTGHDFLGRATGGGSISVWTHHMKDFEFLESVRVGKYSGRGAKFGTGVQTWELHGHMRKYQFTIPAPGGYTVGAFGGYMLGGGHSNVASKHGLLADNILSLEVVTADGRFVHADPTENEELFWALRGGGPSTFGIATSVVMKAHPSVPISRSSFTFSSNVYTNATFWKAVNAYFAQLPRVTAAKGVGWNFINTQVARSGERSFSFEGVFYLLDTLPEQAKVFVQPYVDELHQLGMNISNPEPQFFPEYPDQGFPLNATVSGGASNGRFGSRLIPRTNLLDAKSPVFNATMGAIREFVEFGGYTFHSVDYTPTKEIAGYPGADSAVPPAHRQSIVHATLFDTNQYGPNVSPAQQIANHARLDQYVQKIRDVTPDSGAYMNEADPEEPDFQRSFWGSNYPRLAAIKRKVDPWDVFYTITAVGSERWKVEGTQGLPTQNGRLCRV